MTIIETMDEWNTLSEIFYRDGYDRWQGEYDYYEPEGFHAWFRLDGRPDVEVVTHKEDF